MIKTLFVLTALFMVLMICSIFQDFKNPVKTADYIDDYDENKCFDAEKYFAEFNEEMEREKAQKEKANAEYWDFVLYRKIPEDMDKKFKKRARAVSEDYVQQKKYYDKLKRDYIAQIEAMIEMRE